VNKRRRYKAKARRAEQKLAASLHHQWITGIAKSLMDDFPASVKLSELQAQMRRDVGEY
jgi:hypothetical protein